MSKRQNLYVGRAGQMAVMSELLWRGLNVAIPEVDVGDDIFVVKDEAGAFWRVQVKTATAQPQLAGYSAQFSVSLDQLEFSRNPDLIFVFAVRNAGWWEPFIIIDRRTLLNEHVAYGVGSVSEGNLILRFSVQDSKLLCSRRDFQVYRNDWSRWSILAH